jgi:hypothetical protein
VSTIRSRRRRRLLRRVGGVSAVFVALTAALVFVMLVFGDEVEEEGAGGGAIAPAGTSGDTPVGGGSAGGVPSQPGGPVHTDGPAHPDGPQGPPGADGLGAAGGTAPPPGEGDKAPPPDGGGKGPPPADGGPPPPADAPERVARFLDDTITPLAGAAKDKGVDPATVLPATADVAAAKASGSLSSPQSVAVIAVLESAYKRFNMPFPTIPAPPVQSGGARKPEDAARATTTDGGAKDILRAYFTTTSARLTRQAAARDVDLSSALPTNADVAAAVASGDIASAQSAAVIETLRAASERLDIPFRDPSR